MLFLMQQMLFYLFQRLCNMHGLLFLVILVLFSLLVSCFIHLCQYRYLDLYKTLSHHSCYDQYCYTSRTSLTTYLGSSKRLFCFYYLVKTTLSNSLYSLRDSSSVLVNVFCLRSYDWIETYLNWFIVNYSKVYFFNDCENRYHVRWWSFL